MALPIRSLQAFDAMAEKYKVAATGVVTTANQGVSRARNYAASLDLRSIYVLPILTTLQHPTSIERSVQAIDILVMTVSHAICIALRVMET